MQTNARRGRRLSPAAWAWLAIGLASGLSGEARAQLFPNAPIRRERPPCANEPPFYSVVRHQYFGYYPTCWRKFPPGWACPCPTPEEPEIAELRRRPVSEGTPTPPITDETQDDVMNPEAATPTPDTTEPNPLKTPELPDLPDTSPDLLGPQQPAPGRAPRGNAAPLAGRDPLFDNKPNASARPAAAGTGRVARRNAVEEIPPLSLPDEAGPPASDATDAQVSGRESNVFPESMVPDAIGPDLNPGPVPASPTPGESTSASLAPTFPPSSVDVGPGGRVQAPARRSLLGGLFSGRIRRR